jgi:hypothetical protein
MAHALIYSTAMRATPWLVAAGLAACGGKHATMPDSGTRVDGCVDNAPPAPRMFGIDVAPAPGESYADVLALARNAGASFIPQAIDWSMIEAGPDDTFAHANIDTHKWDVTGPFAGDKQTGVARYTSSAATSGDNLRARYALGGAMSAQVDAALVTAGTTQATLLVRLGTDTTAGNRCSQASDEFVAVVLTQGAVAAASCRDGVFSQDGLVSATSAATIVLRRTATQWLVQSGSTTIAALDVASLPTAFAGPGRLGLFAGDASAAATATFANLHVSGTATWDVASDRFVGDPDFNVPYLLELVHAPLQTHLVLDLRTINTVTTQLPSDLQPSSGLVDLSRADIRQRYRDAVDFLLAAMPDVPIAGFAVGNEIDGYLGANETAWAQVAAFTADVVPYVQGKLPAGTPVGITVTSNGLRTRTADVAAVQASANVVFVTYYPLAPDFSALDPSVVPADVAAMLGATSKPVLLIEAGYPSAAMSASCPACTGSEAKQAAFFHQMFLAYDAYPTQLRGFSVSWLTDASAAAVAGWETYYGVSDPTFIAYLATLGVRAQDGTPKAAWSQIMADAMARGL